MLSFNNLPFLPRKRVAQRYRADLRAQLAQEPASQMLVRLLDLQLGLAPLPDAAALRAAQSSLALYGPPASGRTLLLVQTLVHWAQSNDDAPTLYVPLQEVDVVNLSPRAVLVALINQAGLPAEYANGHKPGVLLFDHWELLTPVRREIWRQFLLNTAAHWPALRFVVALPPDEHWAMLESIQMPTPVPAAGTALLAHLLPEHQFHWAEIVALPGFPPHPSLADLALLALTYPLGGMPASRAQLYAQAFALLQPLIEEQRLLAQHNSDETQQTRGSRSCWTGITIGRALLRHYRLARGFAGGQDLAALAELPLHEQVAVAPLTAALLDDPTPVLEALWAHGPDAVNLQALVVCSLEHPDRAPEYGLRLVEHLLDSAAAERALQLLEELGPILPALFAAASHYDEVRTLAALNALARRVPHARHLWLALLDLPQARDSLRWSLVDALAATPPELLQLQAVATDLDAAALVPRAYLAAVGSSATRALLAQQPLRRGVEHLLADRTAGERRSTVAALLLADPNLPADLRALAVVVVDSPPMVEAAASDAAPVVRQAAHAVLAQSDPETALAVLGRLLAQPAATVEQQCTTLDALASVAHQGASAMLIHATISNCMPLDVRLHALGHLANNSGGDALILRRLLVTTALPVALRAAVAHQLGRRGIAAALPELAQLLRGPAAPLLRRAAASALGDLARQPTLCDAAASALVAGLRRAATDPRLGETIIAALGQSGAPVAVEALATMLSPRIMPLLRQAWLRAIPELAQTPSGTWPHLNRAEYLQITLLDTLAEGQTLADPPSRIEELAERHAMRLASAAAAALAQLGQVPRLHAPILKELRQAVVQEERSEVVRPLLHALGQLSDAGEELAWLLDAPTASRNLRWFALETLGSDRRAGELLRERLALGSDDALLQAQMVAALVAYAEASDIALLRRLAREASGDQQVRLAAIQALARLGEREASAVLVVIAADEDAPAVLRMAAANALPPALAAEAEVTLRQALRGERMPPLLQTALQRALARAGDSTALGYLLRTLQSEEIAEALGCIEEIADLQDSNSAPLLVRLSQNPATPPNVRLAAVIALLHIEGGNHINLLYEYLDASSPPLRIQAYSALAAHRPHDPRLYAPLSDAQAPLALRLQLLAELAQHDANAPIVGQLVAASDESAQLRLAAAAVLRAANQPEAIVSLAAVLKPTSTAPPLLRRRCAAALGHLAQSAHPNQQVARSFLATQALAPDQNPAHRHWAAEFLVGA